MRVKITKCLIVLTLLLTSALTKAQTYTDMSAHLAYTLNGTEATITGAEAGYTTGALNIPASVTDGTNPWHGGRNRQ